MSAGLRVLLMQLSQRTSAKGNTYLSGWLGKAGVVAFPGEPDKHGNPTWDLFVSEPQPRDGVSHVKGASADRTGARHVSPDAPANRSASPVARGDGWRGPSAYRRRNGAGRAPVTGHEPFYDDDLSAVGGR